MNFLKTTFVTLIVSATFLTTAAVAGSTYATNSLNIRTGPGTGYRVVDVLNRGEGVAVHHCRSGWCKISHRGPDGWVSARYLSSTPGINIRVKSKGKKRYHRHGSHGYHSHTRVSAPPVIVIAPVIGIGINFGH